MQQLMEPIINDILNSTKYINTYKCQLYIINWS